MLHPLPKNVFSFMQVSTWRADVVLYACTVHVVTASGIVVWATTLGAGCISPCCSFCTRCSAELVHSKQLYRILDIYRGVLLPYTSGYLGILSRLFTVRIKKLITTLSHPFSSSPSLSCPPRRILHVGPPLLGGSGEGVHELRLACTHHRAGPYPAPCGRARRARRSSAASPSRPSRSGFRETACRCGRP